MRRKDPAVFEYGSGASTLWFAKMAKRVVSIEHVESWYNKMNQVLKQRSMGNVEYHFAGPQRLADADDREDKLKYNSRHKAFSDMHFENYCKMILKDDTLYDLIFVDGASRCICLELAKTRLKEKGIIILDNSARKEYKETIEGFKGWNIISYRDPLVYEGNIDESIVLYKSL